MAYDVLPRMREDDVALGIVRIYAMEISFFISLLALDSFSFIDLLLPLRIQVLYIRFSKKLVHKIYVTDSLLIQFPRVLLPTRIV